MPATIDLLLPLRADPFDPAGHDALRRAVTDRLVGGLWVRDLPVVPAGDQDVGQGADPFAQLSWLVGAGLDDGVATLGTASVVLGIRHPLVTARAVTGLMTLTRRPVVLGVGSGGKPAMNQALGVAGRSLEVFARQWAALREALHSPGAGQQTELVVPNGYLPPPMHLATGDLDRWRAIEGRAEGWQTFIGEDPDRFLRTFTQVQQIRGAPVGVEVRIDATIVGSDAAAVPRPDDRGRVSCTRAALAQLLRTWRQLPVDHLLLTVRGEDPLPVLQELRSSL